MIKSKLLRSLVFLALAAPIGAAPIRVVVWDEQESTQEKVYPNFIGNHIAGHLKSNPALEVKSVRMDDPEFGLSANTLENCDVLIWWGHRRHREIPRSVGQEIVDRIKTGTLSLIAIHSAHFSTPFMMAMEERAVQDALRTLPESERSRATVEWTGDFIRKLPEWDAPVTPWFIVNRSPGGSPVLKMARPNCCFPSYRADGKPSRVKILLPDHPIADGVPLEFGIRETEMYTEPFHVPTPDFVVFEEHFSGGEHFRSGPLWYLGKGLIFYFRPGHQTYGGLLEPYPLRILENAAVYLGQQIQAARQAGGENKER